MTKNSQKYVTRKDLFAVKKDLIEVVTKIVAKSHNELALSIAKGFESVDNRFADIENRMSTKQDMEGIILRLDQVAYKFEVKDLQRRVGRLEELAGIHN